MNVFVLCAGRTGSLALTAAASHMENFTVAHESRINEGGPARLDYPENHFEVDNRLGWFLGRLDKTYGSDAFFVHLMRNEAKVAKSFNQRWNKGVIRAYANGIGMSRRLSERPYDDSRREEVCLDYVRTINSNIESFLKDKTKKMTINLENIETDFSDLWSRVGAEGDLDAALGEFKQHHNSSESYRFRKTVHWSRKLPAKLWRVMSRFPEFVLHA